MKEFLDIIKEESPHLDINKFQSSLDIFNWWKDEDRYEFPDYLKLLQKDRNFYRKLLKNIHKGNLKNG